MTLSPLLYKMRLFKCPSDTGRAAGDHEVQDIVQQARAVHGTLVDWLIQGCESMRVSELSYEHHDLWVSASSFSVTFLCSTSHTLPGSDPWALCSQQNFYIYTGLFMIYREC